MTPKIHLSSSNSTPESPVLVDRLVEGIVKLLDLHGKKATQECGNSIFANKSSRQQIVMSTFGRFGRVIPFLGDHAINGPVRPELVEGWLWQYTAPSNGFGIRTF